MKPLIKYLMVDSIIALPFHKPQGSVFLLKFVAEMFCSSFKLYPCLLLASTYVNIRTVLFKTGSYLVVQMKLKGGADREGRRGHRCVSDRHENLAFIL